MSRDPSRHVLKTWPAPFKALADGHKTFEFRKDDRGFEVGDMLVLREWRPNPNPTGLVLTYLDGDFTGSELIRWVTYILRGPAFDLPEGYVVMSVTPERPTETK